MCVFFSSSFVCISAYANVYFKTTIIKPSILTAGVPSSQVLPGFLITAPPFAFVSAVLCALTVWIQKQKKKNPINHLCSLTGKIDFRRAFYLSFYLRAKRATVKWFQNGGPGFPRVRDFQILDLILPLESTVSLNCWVTARGARRVPFYQ